MTVRYQGPRADVLARKRPPVDLTVAETVEWVGDDPARAEAALEVEDAREKPRASVKKAIEPVAEKA